MGKAPQTNRSFEGEEELNESQLSDLRNKSTINRQITFKVFLKAIEHISLLAYPELDAEFAIKYVIKHHLEKVLNGERLTVSGSNIKEQFNQLMKMLKDPAVVFFIHYDSFNALDGCSCIY